MGEAQPGDVRWVNKEANRFERAWKKVPRPPIEDYLADLTEPRRGLLLDELVRVERQLRQQAGEEPSPAEYHRRFPDDAAAIDAAFGPASTDRPGAESAPDDAPPPFVEGPGTVIAGRYKLLEEIGEGGMGTVWVAQQTEPVRRKVALKLIKPGMDSRRILARFDAERQALAMMDHPNIARVLDAGRTDGGRPFFVMELVKGTPIATYCDERRLTPRQRLELFVPVCQAIQHAHQKGVIHRDIKPSNVLVALYDEHPVPKVIDFGVAKAIESPLTDLSLDTGFGAVVGTPEYMSPEQATLNNLDIDTRSDVYALGVLLYELLTGTTPVDRKGLGRAAVLEVLRIVREVEAPRPSTRLSTLEALPSIAASRSVEPARLAGLLRGELDWVVMKALEKDRKGRYQTANELALDVQRYLADEMVEARPPSAGYRLRKFARKHRAALTAASLFAALLVVSATISTVLAIRARRAESATKRALTRVQEEQSRAEAALAARNEALTAERKASALAKEQRALAEARERRAIEARDDARRSAYAARINLARREWDNANVAHARELLENPDEAECRGFEWYYLKRLYYPELFTLKGLLSAVDVSFSPDGKRVAAATLDDMVKIWDTATGRELRTLKGHTRPVYGVSFSRDGQRLASASVDETVKVWDTATAQEVLTLKGHTDIVWKVSFSPDGKRLASSDHRTTRLWDAATGRELLTLKGPFSPSGGVAFSPDGKRLASASDDRTIKLYDIATSQVALTLQGHTDSIVDVSFSPDGRRLASTSVDRTTRLWDAATGRELLRLEGPFSLSLAITFSPDGKRLASRSGQAIKLWDTATAQGVLTLKGHTGDVGEVQFSPDGQLLASVSDDQTIRLWDTATGQEVVTLKGHTDDGSRMPVMRVLFSPDGERLASVDNRTIKLWGQEVLTLKGHISYVSRVWFSPDGKRLASASLDPSGGTLKFWDTAARKDLLTLKGHTSFVHGVSFSPDGKRLASASEDHTIKLWDTATGEDLLTLKGHTSGVFGVTFSRDGKRLASAGAEDHSVKLWDTATGQELLTLQGHTTAVRGVSFSRDSQRLASASDDHTIKLWDAATGQELRTLKGHASTVYGVSFSPDGRRLASASDDHTIKLWDAATGQELLTLKGHTRPVYGVSFDPDGKRLASASDDRTVKLWDAVTGQELRTLKGHTDDVFEVSFSPDGRRLASASKDRSVKLWDLTTGQELLTLEGHTSGVSGVSFSPDGKRLASASVDGTVKIWLGEDR